MATRTRSNFKSTKNTLITTNGTGDISGSDINNMLEDAADSTVFWEDDVLDEDDMASDSDTAVPTQQSVRAYVDNYAAGFSYLERTITSAEILNMFSAPVELVPAGGANVFMTLIGIILTIDYAGTPYATNTTINIRRGLSNYGTATTLLGTTSDKLIQFFDTSEETTAPDNNLNLSVATGNPTAGNSDMKVRLWYKAVTL